MSVRLRKWKSKEGKVQEAWWVDVKYQHPDGRVERIRKASPINTRRGAEEYERQVRHALLTGALGKEQQEEKRVLTVAEFEPRFITYSENQNKASTLAAKQQLLKSHLLPIFGSMRLDRVSREAIEDFKARKRKEGLTAKTINNALTVIRTLFAVAVEQEELTHAPRVKLLKAEKPEFDFLNFEEADRLVRSAEPTWRAMVTVALHTGLRRGELIALQWDVVDLVAGRLVVKRNVWRGHFGSPKGGRSREVPLNAIALDALKAHRHLRGPFVFCDDAGDFLKNDTCRNAILRTSKRAGLRPIGWHTLRHSFASHLVMRGVPLKAIQELLGHASIEMTMRYAHLSPDVKKDAVRALESQPRGTLGAHG
ncbi:tyrosine-type recombinase/integrase [Corallococcus exiguus]|uniref:tyrosine-type recombinase/integrase n=1 Tax=Corallococcus exiguus TaxID=83462 RepID=UPI0014721116|nr:tyrosine-type recombinase/integrase [Corallococcus exiguus]NNB84591.1 tyrosine-type recombinase/integrase [Corallococcus exiguus]